jgi:hypothetical protein
LSEEGIARLEAYIGGFPRRLKSVAVEKMLAAASLEEALANTVAVFAWYTEGKIRDLLRLRKHRAVVGESAS